MQAATALAMKALQAWEARDDTTLATCLSEDFVGSKLLPQPISKDQLLDFMRAMLKAFPDWSFQAAFLNEHLERSQDTVVHFVTQITGTHSGDFVMPELPIIPPTETKIALSARHLDLLVRDGLIMAIRGDFSPDCLSEVLAQLGMELP